MLKDLAIKKTVYLVTGYTDLRNGIDGLAAFVQAIGRGAIIGGNVWVTEDVAPGTKVLQRT